MALKTYSDPRIKLDDYDLAHLNEEQQNGVLAGKAMYFQGLDTDNQDLMNAGNTFANNYRHQSGYDGGDNGITITPYGTPASTSVQRDAFSFSAAPQRISQNDAAINALRQQILNRPAFSYDYNEDPAYQALAEEYGRRGDQNMHNVLTQVNARTGGLADSWALSAAQQAKNSYDQQLVAQIPALRQAAYQMYLAEGDRLRQNYNMLLDADNTDYNRYRDSYNDWLNNRQFAYGQYRDDYNDTLKADQTAYDRAQDAKTWDRTNRLDAANVEQTAYNREQERLDRERQDRLDAANANNVAYNRAMDQAEITGNYEAMRAYGWSDARIAEANATAAAAQRLKSAALKSSGSSTTEKNYTELLSDMRKFGNDDQAYGYLLSQGLSKDFVNSVWNMYKGTSSSEPSASLDSVKKKAASYKDLGEAQSYLESMVDNGYITADEAADIYVRDLGGSVGAAASGSAASAPKTYSEYVALTGDSTIMSESEFYRHKGSSSNYLGCKTYQEFLAQRYNAIK